MNRSRMLLFLVTLLVLAISYAWLETPRQQRQVAPAGLAQETSRDSAASSQPGSRAEIGLDFSGGRKLDYKAPQRDLFRPLYAEPKSVVDIVAKAPEPEPEKTVVFTPPPAPLTRPAAVPAFTGKPIPPLKVLGSLQKGESLSVFLSSGQGDIYVVKQGERFADDLFVRELTAETIVISRAGTDKELTLSLSENKSAQRNSSNFVPQRTIAPRMGFPARNTINPSSPPMFQPPDSVGSESTADP